MAPLFPGSCRASTRASYAGGSSSSFFETHWCDEISGCTGCAYRVHASAYCICMHTKDSLVGTSTPQAHCSYPWCRRFKSAPSHHEVGLEGQEAGRACNRVLGGRSECCISKVGEVGRDPRWEHFGSNRVLGGTPERALRGKGPRWRDGLDEWRGTVPVAPRGDSLVVRDAEGRRTEEGERTKVSAALMMPLDSSP